MKTLTVCDNDGDQRLDKFLTKTFKDLPKSLIYKQIRKKNIKLDGKRTDASVILKAGQTLTLYIEDKFLNSKKNLDFLKAKNELNVLYEDKNLIIINKDVGVLCHSDKNNPLDSLVDRVRKYLYNKKEYAPQNEFSFAPALVNRLDRNTSGLAIAAKNAEALRILCEKIKTRQIKKFYICLVEGYIKQKENELFGFISKNRFKNKSKISNKKQDASKKALLRYKVVLEKNFKSLVEVNLITGRSHQIRSQFASIGHPLVSDVKYGAKKNPLFEHQALSCYKIIFCFENDNSLLYLKDKEFVDDSYLVKLGDSC